MPKIYRDREEGLTGRTVIRFYCMKCGKEKKSALGRFCERCKKKMREDAGGDGSVLPDTSK